MADTVTLTLALAIILSVAYFYLVHVVSPPNPPNTPVTIPYLIPWIGSLFSFNRDPLGFLKECHLRYGSSYKISVTGRTFVVIADPEGIASVSRDTTSHLDHKAAFSHMLLAIGGPRPESVNFILDLLDTKIFPVVKKHLAPASMSDLTQRIDPLLSRELNAFDMGDSPFVSLDLSELIGRPIYNAGCRALFGPNFALDSFRDFVALDEHLPQLLTRLPFIARRGKEARSRMVSMLEGYIDTWWSGDGREDIPEASPSVMQFVTELKASQVSRRDAAGTLLLFLWGFHSNMWFMITWLLTHLMVDDIFMTRMRTEIREFKSMHSLDQLDSPEYSLPILESAIQETLRWATTATTARFATENTTVTVGGVPIPILKDEWVLGDIRAVHHNPKVYKDPHTFQFDRYTAHSQGVPHPPKPFPWGQGKHMCPGRHLAVHIMRRFVVELLSIYEVKPTSGSSTIPAVSTHHFLGSLKSKEAIPVTLSLRT